jgi:hypothetical protein
VIFGAIGAHFKRRSHEAKVCEVDPSFRTTARGL